MFLKVFIATISTFIIATSFMTPVWNEKNKTIFPCQAAWKLPFRPHSM